MKTYGQPTNVVGGGGRGGPAGFGIGRGFARRAGHGAKFVEPGAAAKTSPYALPMRLALASISTLNERVAGGVFSAAS
jgi:hypothetical protein